LVARDQRRPRRPRRAGGRLDLELEAWPSVEGLFVVADDLEAFSANDRERLRDASGAGATIVAVGEEADLAPLVTGKVRSFVVPPLDDAAALDLVRRAVPSLPERLARHLLERTGRRPGALRAFVRAAAGALVTSIEEIDALLDASPPRASLSPSSRAEAWTELTRLLDTGHFDRAAEALASIEAATSEAERIDLAVARARILLARNDVPGAAATLDAVTAGTHRGWYVARARTAMRAGDSGEAARLAAVAFREIAP